MDPHMDMDTDLQQMLEANLPANIFRSCCDTYGSGDVQTAASDQKETTGNLCKAPVLRALQTHIQNKRKKNGEPEIQLEVTTSPKDFQLTPEEKAKKLKRKEQNRLAARRCRQKKKSQETGVRKKYEITRKRNQELHSDLDRLSRFKTKAEEWLRLHLAVCCIRPPSHQSPNLTSSDQIPQNQQLQKPQRQSGFTFPTGTGSVAFDDMSSRGPVLTNACTTNTDVELGAQLGPTTLPSNQDFGEMVLDSVDLEAVLQSFRSHGVEMGSMEDLNTLSGSDAALPSASAAASPPSAVSGSQSMPTSFSVTTDPPVRPARVPNETLMAPSRSQHCTGLAQAFRIATPTPTPPHQPMDVAQDVISESNAMFPCRSAQPLPGGRAELPALSSSSLYTSQTPSSSGSNPQLISQTSLLHSPILYNDALPDVNPPGASFAAKQQPLPELPGYPFHQTKTRHSSGTSHNVSGQQNKPAPRLPQKRTSTACTTSTISMLHLQNIASSLPNHSQHLIPTPVNIQPSLIPPDNNSVCGYSPASSATPAGGSRSASTSASTAYRPALTPPPATAHRPHQHHPAYQRFTPSAPPDAYSPTVTPPPPAYSSTIPLPSPGVEERDLHDDELLMVFPGHQQIPILPFGGAECGGDSSCLLSSHSLIEMLQNWSQSSQEN